MKLGILRLLLFTSALSWGASALLVILPWPIVTAALTGLGSGDVPSDVMIQYWTRMTAGAFTGIGLFFLALGLRPAKFANVVGLAGILMSGEGIILLVHGLLLGLRPFPFYADVTFSLCVGAGIWCLRNEASKSA